MNRIYRMRSGGGLPYSDSTMRKTGIEEIQGIENWWLHILYL
jgi:hypothetical protein